MTSVDPDGQAGSRGVKLGDRMVEINGKLIPNNMPDPVLAEMLFGLPRPINLGFRYAHGPGFLPLRAFRREWVTPVRLPSFVRA